MIQRIQSVWLLLVTAFAALTFKLPCYVGSLTGGVPSSLSARTTVPLMIVTAVIAILALVIIFLYKNRPLQFKLSLLGILLQLLLLFLYYKEVKSFTAGDPTLWSVLYGAGIFFFVFAARGIYKDEKLVKDSNRLR